MTILMLKAVSFEERQNRHLKSVTSNKEGHLIMKMVNTSGRYNDYKYMCTHIELQNAWRKTWNNDRKADNSNNIWITLTFE